MTEKPDKIKNGATLAYEWQEKGYHCQVYADYRYLAGVIEGELVVEKFDTTLSGVTREMRKDLDYRPHKWRTEDLALTYDEDEEIPQEYRCPVCENRVFSDVPSTDVQEDVFTHLKESHPEKFFPEP